MKARHLLPSVLALVVVAACSAPAPEPPAPRDPIVLGANVEDAAQGVRVDTVVEATAQDGHLSGARLTTADGKTTIAGSLTDGIWRASARLEPATTYRLVATGTGEDGKEGTLARTFTTQALTLDEQTYPSVAPLQGETVGVGMPVIVWFDLPVENKELFERNMAVRSTPAVEGSWNWLSDREVHYRPKEYWPAGTKVTVDLDLNSLDAGNGIFGQQDQLVDFTIGRKAVTVVDSKRHRLTYKLDGRKVRTIPVSTGDKGHQTRRGTKVIMEKFSSIDMDAATTGVDSEDPGYYNMKGVRWAMRVTNSGEFLHAAPWSQAFHGRANVSHGCVGMSLANAKWLYERSRRGDLVKFVGSSRPLEDRNGWTDWNVPWDAWTAGSAIPADDTQTDAA